MLPQSYIRSTLTKISILFVVNVLIALAMAALCGCMLWAITTRPAWQFAVIALFALVGADMARTNAVNLLRQTRFWKKWLH